MSSRKRHEGYLFVDHRASPGLPEDVAIQAGYDPKQCQEGKILETATLTCSHCKITCVKNPLRTREREYCRKCDHYICDFCYFKSQQPDYVHFPFAKQADFAMDGKTLMGTPMELLI